MHQDEHAARLQDSVVRIPGTTNTRDLGGFPARDGRRIRPGALLRAEALAHPGPEVRRVALWSHDAVETYRALRLATVVDLRGDGETTLAPSAWAEASGARLERIPMEEGGEGDATDFMRRIRAGTLREFGPTDLAEYYRRTVRANARQIGAVLAAIARPAGVPVLIHCAAGKDRTGLVIALLLDLLGVERELIVADYALTSVLRPGRVAAYADVLKAAGIEPEAVSALFEAPAETMRDLLAGIESDHGSVRRFLEVEAGVDGELVARLEASLLEPTLSS